MHQGEVKENDSVINIMQKYGVGYKVYIDQCALEEERFSFTTQNTEIGAIMGLKQLCRLDSNIS